MNIETREHPMHHSNLTRLVLAAFACLALLACEEDDSPDEATASGVTFPASAHAPASAQPGSHEDWCGAHEVPESLCTRCNPSLVAAFKATGDWCEEHDLPESQCLICNPELRIVRPPPEASP